jgi:hypothetical protein
MQLRFRLIRNLGDVASDGALDPVGDNRRIVVNFLGRFVELSDVQHFLDDRLNQLKCVDDEYCGLFQDVEDLQVHLVHPFQRRIQLIADPVEDCLGRSL